MPGSVFYSDIAEKVKLRRNAKQKPVIELENVSDTCNGVFQTVKENVNDSNLDSMRVQVGICLHVNCFFHSAVVKFVWVF